MLGPWLLALATELKLTMLTSVHFRSIFITFCDLVALRVGTVGFLRIYHYIQVLFKALVLCKLFLTKKFLKKVVLYLTSAPMLGTDELLNLGF
jgi:hypothetical protein